MTTGIIIVAVKHPYYMELAVNLAVSIKYNSTGIPVCIVHDGLYDHLPNKKKAFFDDQILIDSSQAFSIKTQLYNITPYDRTLYMDADTIILPNVQLLSFISRLEGFNIINEKKDKDYCIWADAADVRKLTGNMDAPFFHYFSELIFFEKNDKMANFFKEIEYAYLNSAIAHRTIADEMPDELAYLIASMRTGVVPNIINWSPLFWHFRNRRDSSLPAYQLSKKYIGYSIGGNVLPEYVKASYNGYLTFFEHKLNIKGLTKVADKRLIFRNRIKL